MHTPGPWMIEADPCHYDTLSTVVGGESQQRKSRIWRQVHVEVGGFAEVAEQEANARLIAAAPDLYEALSDVEFLFARPGENSVERFERLAEAFYRDTGLLAPGKDAPAAGGQPDREERSEKYDAWIDAKIASARAALQRVSPQAIGQQD